MTDSKLPNPPPREYSEDGVDLSLIRWMLSLTPAERLEAHKRHLDLAMKLQRANG